MWYLLLHKYTSVSEIQHLALIIFCFTWHSTLHVALRTTLLLNTLLHSTQAWP